MKNFKTLKAVCLAKKYQKRNIVNSISISVNKGEAVGLLGPNGAGKTTTFYMLSGLVRADKGSIFLDDYDITNLPMYKRAQLGIGYLPQESSVFRGMTVAQNIMAVLEFVEPESYRREERLEELLAEFSITYLKNSDALSLSGGERRKVEIARTLAMHPQFILLDEPLSGIDPISIEDIRNLITHLKSLNIGILITDHNVYETLNMVERAYIIHAGSVLKEGTPKTIIRDKQVKKIYLGNLYPSHEEE